MGPNQNRSPTLLAALSPTTKSQLVRLTSAVSMSPMTSMSSMCPLPRPASVARRMHLTSMGSKPMSLAATASTAT